MGFRERARRAVVAGGGVDGSPRGRAGCTGARDQEGRRPSRLRDAQLVRREFVFRVGVTHDGEAVIDAECAARACGAYAREASLG